MGPEPIGHVDVRMLIAVSAPKDFDMTKKAREIWDGKSLWMDLQTVMAAMQSQQGGLIVLRKDIFDLTDRVAIIPEASSYGIGR